MNLFNGSESVLTNILKCAHWSHWKRMDCIHRNVRTGCYTAITNRTSSGLAQLRFISCSGPVTCCPTAWRRGAIFYVPGAEKNQIWGAGGTCPVYTGCQLILGAPLIATAAQNRTLAHRSGSQTTGHPGVPRELINMQVPRPGSPGLTNFRGFQCRGPWAALTCTG